MSKVTKVRLVSRGKTEAGKPTRTFYTTTKGKNKLKKRKFDPRAFNEETGKIGCHVWFEEEKMK